MFGVGKFKSFLKDTIWKWVKMTPARTAATLIGGVIFSSSFTADDRDILYSAGGHFCGNKDFTIKAWRLEHTLA